MGRGRGRLPVLAEIAGPVAGDERAFSLARADFEALAGLNQRLAGVRSLLVTGEGERGGTLAVSLAGAASAAGRRTALLECDLARPRLAADLGLAQTPGLHEYLRWEATAPEVMQPLGLAGTAARGADEPLVCISAGRQAPDPAILLGLGSFRHMTAKLRHAYDLVVLAGPELGAARGGIAAVAAQADGVLAGVGPGGSSRRGLRSLRAALQQVPATALGAVVVGEA